MQRRKPQPVSNRVWPEYVLILLFVAALGVSCWAEYRDTGTVFVPFYSTGGLNEAPVSRPVMGAGGVYRTR